MPPDQQRIEIQTRHSQLIICDGLSFEGLQQPFPRGVASSQILELHLMSWCFVKKHERNVHPDKTCSIGWETLRHHDWIESMTAQMPNLSAIHIKLALTPHKYLDDCVNRQLRHWTA